MGGLEAALRAPADPIVLSSIQLLSDSHIYERWGTFPLEKRLMTLLQAAGPSLVVRVIVTLEPYHDQRFPDLWNSPPVPPMQHRTVRTTKNRCDCDFTGADFGRLKFKMVCCFHWLNSIHWCRSNQSGCPRVIRKIVA